MSTTFVPDPKPLGEVKPIRVLVEQMRETLSTIVKSSAEELNVNEEFKSDYVEGFIDVYAIMLNLLAFVSDLLPDAEHEQAALFKLIQYVHEEHLSAQGDEDKAGELDTHMYYTGRIVACEHIKALLGV